jgi:hypothetical protein
MNSREDHLGNRMFMIDSAYCFACLHSCHLYFIREIMNEIKTIFISDLSLLLLSSITFHLIVNNTWELLNKTSKDIVCEYIREHSCPSTILLIDTLIAHHTYWSFSLCEHSIATGGIF